MPLEKQLEKRCKFFVEGQLGGLFIKLYGLKGIPDRMVLLPGGVVIFIEFKRPGSYEKPKKLQGWWLRKLTKMGFRAFWCNDYEDFVFRLLNVTSEI